MSVAVPVCGWVVYTVYCVFLLLSVLFAAGGRSLFVQSEWHWTNDSAVVLGTFWGTYSFYLTLLHLAIVRLFHGFVHQIHLCQFVVGNFRNNCFQLDVLFMDEWVDSMLSTHWLDSFCAACSMPDHINWHVQLWDYPSLFHLFLDFIFVSLFAISTVVKTDQIWHEVFSWVRCFGDSETRHVRITRVFHVRPYRCDCFTFVWPRMHFVIRQNSRHICVQFIQPLAAHHANLPSVFFTVSFC